ncbi:hypothetical protein [Arcobacter arenosus]|jgi:hypothetical protein|uniref:DUF302 domain-containing protein n=1 Tax=Arcobacter arenosus TaxID=2576037 RepID=A0A5R8Y0C6_9BACT|nr:hypothetical protein [Arcobacter arenosus]TLP38319.1 hypothetical protein FDK22_07545 [Arcobacter arenosus]
MIKSFFTLIILTLSINAYEIIDNDNNFIVKIQNKNFYELYVNLKDEINFNSYVIVHELNLAKSTKAVADALEEKAVVKNGINLLICKTSFTLKMHQENIHNMSFCPMVISVYEDNNSNYISFRKYHPLNENDKIALTINKRLKTLILNSLD